MSYVTTIEQAKREIGEDATRNEVFVYAQALHSELREDDVNANIEFEIAYQASELDYA